MTLVKKSPAQIYRAIDVVRTIKELIEEDGRRLDKVSDLHRFRACVYTVAWLRFNEAERQLNQALTPEVVLHGQDGDVDKSLFDLIAPLRSIGPRSLKRLLDAKLFPWDS